MGKRTRRKANSHWWGASTCTGHRVKLSTLLFRMSLTSPRLNNVSQPGAKLPVVTCRSGTRRLLCSRVRAWVLTLARESQHSLVNRCTGVHVYMCSCVHVYMCTGEQVYRCTGVQVCTAVNMLDHFLA